MKVKVNTPLAGVEFSVAPGTELDSSKPECPLSQDDLRRLVEAGQAQDLTEKKPQRVAKK